MNRVTAELEFDPITDLDAIVNYTRSTAQRSGYFGEAALRGAQGVESDPRNVTIHDARRLWGLGLDRSGFELLRHHGTLGNWQAFSDARLVREIDYPEVARALQTRCHARKVLIIDHRLRAGTMTWEGAPRRFEAVRRVQPAMTFRLAAQQVIRHLNVEEAALRLQRRFAILQVLRPIGGRAADVPFALCDARTIKAEDLFASAPNCSGWPDEPLQIGFHSQHRWYWYPQHAPNEAAIVKIFDSAAPPRAAASTYSAFDNPSGAGTALEASIELRALVFW
jgi:hypothetical protein